MPEASFLSWRFLLHDLILKAGGFLQRMPAPNFPNLRLGSLFGVTYELQVELWDGGRGHFAVWGKSFPEHFASQERELKIPSPFMNFQ